MAEEMESQESGSGELSKDEKTMGMLCHIFPLIIWLIKKNEMPFVDDQGKESLNFAITIIIIMIGLSIIAWIPIIGWIIGCFGIPIVCIGVLVLVIMGAMAANKGEKYRYPINIRLIK